MFNLLKFAVLAISVVIVRSKACGRCNCSILHVVPPSSTISKDVLLVNCSDSGFAKTVNFPDVSLYTFSEIELESSRNKHDSVKQFSVNPVTKLNLARNEIRNIDDEAFVLLTKLLDLDLSYNKMKDADLNAETFKGMKNLKKLNLYETVTLRLKTTVFSEMRSLVELDLGHNFLDGELEPKIFDQLTNLQVLSLAANNLQSIHDDTFLKMTHLKMLNVSGNSLEVFGVELLMKCNEIRVLDLSKNKLESVDPAVFKNLDMLEVLNLGFNNIKQFDSDLVLAKSLKVLDFGHNELEDVDFLSENLFADLQEMYLQDNLLKTVDLVKKFNTIQILNVSSNQLTTFPKTSLSRLATLDLSNNTFQSIPDVVNGKDLPSLARLQLDYNPITDVNFPSSPQPFRTLTFISISNMPDLTTIKTTSFQNLKRTSQLVKRQTEDNRESFDRFVEDDYDVADDNQESLFDEIPKEDAKGDLVDPENGNVEVKEGVDVEKESIEDKSVFVGDIDEIKDDVGSPTEAAPKEKEDDEVPDENEAPVTVADSSSSEENEDEVDVKETSPKVEEVVVQEDSSRSRMGDNGDKKEEVEPVVKPPVADTSDEVKSVTKRVATAQTQKTVVDDCSRGGLHLVISKNKNLDTIEAGALTDMNLCMLDLSSNSLTAVPESVVDWEGIPAIDLQHNPWDCSCQQQWLLDTIVPKLYTNKPELLYELRCGSPALLVNRRFVHYYNWSEKAFCVEQKGRLLKAEDTNQNEVGVVLKLGDSTGTIIIIGVCCGIVLLLVAVGILLQWRMTVRRRNRNRRF